MSKKTVFTIIYTIIVGLEVVSSEIPSLSAVNYVAKPAIISSLLMFAGTNELFFIFGLIAFLLAHLVYIKIFSFNQNKSLNIWATIIGFGLYGALFFLLLKDHLGSLLVPVAVYMLVILCMGLFAYRRRGKVSLESFRLVFMGALLFMVSDSILALNKFYIAITSSGFLIMATYSFAQYFIVNGLLKNK